MSKIFVGQSALTIRLETGQTLTTATVEMGYEKPSGTRGLWSATIYGTTVVQYVVASESILDEAGTWKIWAKVTFADLKVAYGKAATMVVSEVGSL